MKTANSTVAREALKVVKAQFRHAYKVLKERSVDVRHGVQMIDSNSKVPRVITDTERVDWLARAFRTSTVYMDGQHPWSPANFKMHQLRGPTFRDAIDAAIRKERGE